MGESGMHNLQLVACTAFSEYHTIIVKPHLQVWSQRSTVTTSTPRIPHSDLITINRKRGRQYCSPIHPSTPDISSTETQDESVQCR